MPSGFACQKDDHASGIFRLIDSCHSRRHAPFMSHLLAYPTRIGCAWVNCIDGNAKRRQLRCKAERKSFDCAFRCDVGQLPWHWPPILPRAHANDTTTKTAQRFSPSGELHSQQESGAHVHCVVRIKLGCIEQFKSITSRVGRVVHQDVRHAQPFLRSIHDLHRAIWMRQIDFHMSHLHA